MASQKNNNSSLTSDSNRTDVRGKNNDSSNNTGTERKHDSEYTDAAARRDPTQTHDSKGEAQNVNDDTGRPLNEDELQHERNKASQGRDEDERDR